VLDRTLRRFGVAVAGVIVHHDRDPVYTSDDWGRRVLIEDQARLSYALRGARDNNAEMQSFNGRFKGENRELFREVESFDQLAALVAVRMQHCNSKRRHSSLARQPAAQDVRPAATRRGGVTVNGGKPSNFLGARPERNAVWSLVALGRWRCVSG
jgi:transposase InsO family protein